MADSYELRQFERLALVVGPSAALRLCAFFGSRSLYVPRAIPDGHVIVRLIGREAADYLVAECGEQSLSIPACELSHLRRAGKVHALTRHHVPVRTIALAMDITPARVAQLRKQLRLEGYADLLHDIEETPAASPDHAAREG